jgi:hypothetical protein
MNFKKCILFLFFSALATAQELKCSVTLNYDKVTNVNPQIFKTLEKQIFDFMNNTKFTEKNTTNAEKINCSLFLTINSFNSNDFETSLQVNAIRPIFNTTYSSPLLNINDKEVNFKYIEFENFIYDPNSFTNNLVAVLTFYANVVIGVEADSFALKSGTSAFEKALNMQNVAQSSSFGGWTQTGKGQNRYNLITDLLSGVFEPFREAQYQYHLKGLDVMAADLKSGKNNVAKAIETLSEINKSRPNSFLTRIFFDAKSDEIVNVFTGGPSMDLSQLIETLNTISPLNSTNWNKIR